MHFHGNRRAKGDAGPARVLAFVAGARSFLRALALGEGVANRMRCVTPWRGACHWAESIGWFYAEAFDRGRPESFPDDPGQGVFTCQKESRTPVPL